MKFNNRHIPVYTTENFRHKYFQQAREVAGHRAPATPLFEIHRRSDTYYRCQPNISPNRLDFYMVVLVAAGEGLKTFGADEYHIKKGMLSFVGPGMITNWKALDDHHEGFVCLFNAAFLQLDHYPFFEIGGCPVMQLDDAQYEYFYRLFANIEQEYQADQPQQMDIIRAFLTAILKKSQQIYGEAELPQAQDSSNAAQRITAAFQKLVEKDFENMEAFTLKGLDEYARQLNVTQNHLNDTVRAVSGKTPGTLLRERIIKEAAQLLVQTKLSVAEICFLFNFTDPSYFTRFFKRYTGLTPGQYRDHRNSLANIDD